MSITVESIEAEVEQPQVEAHVEPAVSPPVEEEPTVSAVDAKHSTAEQPVEKPNKKPKGHRKKDENTRKTTEKVTCPACAKVVSLHNLRYTHAKYCSAAPKLKESVVVQPIEEVIQERLAEAPQPVHFDVNEEIRKMMHFEKANKRALAKAKYKKLLENKI